MQIREPRAAKKRPLCVEKKVIFLSVMAMWFSGRPCTLNRRAYAEVESIANSKALFISHHVRFCCSHTRRVLSCELA